MRLAFYQNTHRVLTFKINMDMNDPELPLVLNNYMMVSSERLQHDLPFDQLQICHQYVFIDAYIEFQAILVNHTSDILYFRKRQLVGLV